MSAVIGPVQNVITRTVDPTAGNGVQAGLGQLLVRKPTSSVYVKTGSAATAWTLIAGGGGGGTVDVGDDTGPLGAFDTVNFLGEGVTAADAGGGAVDVVIPGTVFTDGNTVTGDGSAADPIAIAGYSGTWLELSTLARECELAGNTIDKGAGQFTQGNDLVPTRDGLTVYGARLYIPTTIPLTGHTIRMSLWDPRTPFTRLKQVDYVVQAGDIGTCISVLWATPYACTAYKNIMITSVDMDAGAPQYWLNTQADIAATIWGSRPGVIVGELLRVAIHNGMWRCGSYYKAGDTNPSQDNGGTFADPLNQSSCLDPILDT